MVTDNETKQISEQSRGTPAGKEGGPTPSHGPGGAATHLPQDKTARIPAYLQSKMFCEEGSNFKLFRSEKTQPFSKTFTI